MVTVNSNTVYMSPCRSRILARVWSVACTPRISKLSAWLVVASTTAFTGAHFRSKSKVVGIELMDAHIIHAGQWYPPSPFALRYIRNIFIKNISWEIEKLLYMHDTYLSPPPPTRQLQAQVRRQTELKKAIAILQEANTTRSQEVWSASDGGTKKKPTIANDSGSFATLSSVDQASLTSVERPTLPPHDAKHGKPTLNALEGGESQPQGTHGSGTATLRSLSPNTEGVVDIAAPAQAAATSSNNEVVVAAAAEGETPGPTTMSTEQDNALSGSNTSPCSPRPATESPMVSLVYLIQESESISDIDLLSSLGSTESVSSNS